jgi:hypothetical protein
MTAPSRPGRRVHIDRLELDLRGIAPATADAAARALGPALARTLASPGGHVAPADRMDAGRITSPAAPGAHDLAARIATHIARTIRREGA